MTDYEIKCEKCKIELFQSKDRVASIQDVEATKNDGRLRGHNTYRCPKCFKTYRKKMG